MKRYYRYIHWVVLKWMHFSPYFLNDPHKYRKGRGWYFLNTQEIISIDFLKKDKWVRIRRSFSRPCWISKIMKRDLDCRKWSSIKTMHQHRIIVTSIELSRFGFFEFHLFPYLRIFLAGKQLRLNEQNLGSVIKGDYTKINGFLYQMFVVSSWFVSVS